ncbi:MAG: SlyX family protein [Panacagrimonas sp.]|jgi:SlyX protein|nr:SlyX family protein [Panacagrimonas sp.]MCC2656944.1 SlyX family protein [Panacagrimonas sp.]
MTEDRFIDLETRLAYQDDAIRSLSDTIARQQKQLDQLESLTRQLLERVKTLNEPVFKGTAADEIPPHY